MINSAKMSDDKVISGRSKQERGEIDTKAPFESVKAAVSLFGEKADGRKPRFHEKGVSSDVEIGHTHEELLKVREQLAKAEEVNAKALRDLTEARKSLEQIIERPKERKKPSIMEGSEAVIEKVGHIEQGPINIQEKHVVWEALHGDTKEEHTTAIFELESEKKQLADMKRELLVSSQEKDAALKQTERALVAAEVNAKRAEYLTTELAGNNESLVLLKLACIEANKEKLAFLKAKQSPLKAPSTDDPKDLRTPNQEFQVANELECKLLAMINESERLQAEMISLKESEVKLANVATMTLAHLTAPKIELERTKMSGESAAASLQSLSTELEETKLTLQKESENKASLIAVLESLRTELEMMKKELMGLKERESNATSAAGVLASELLRFRAQLKAAVEAEAKATEAIAGLSQAFEHVQAEATEAKAEAEARQEEAITARSELDEAKEAMQSAENLLQNALQEVDVSKTAEAAATARLKPLTDKINTTRALEVESGTEIKISQNEHDFLKRKVQEAGELPNMRLAAAMAQIEAVRAGEQEILWKVIISGQDVDSIKSEMKAALNRAQMAEAAKTALEAELKRLREREQQRDIAAQQRHTWNGENRHSLSFTRPLPIGHLGNVLNINTTPVQTQILRETDTQKQKKPLMKSLKSYLSRRKSASADFT